MNVLMRIKRYDPEQDSKPYWAEYRVEVDPIDRLLDALNTIKWTKDGTLTYRRSCAHGVCGSDAMRINGRNRLACKVLMRDVGNKVTIEPMLGYPVIRDWSSIWMASLKNTSPSSHTSSTTTMNQAQNACRVQHNARSMMRGQNVFFVVPVPAPAHRSGAIPTGWDLRQSSTPIALSSTAVTKAQPNAYKFLAGVMASGVAVPSSTVLMLVHVAFL